jgi:hypothetical protein
MRIEFVLCISFAFTKIETAHFIVVAQFATIPNPSSKTAKGKEENHHVAERNSYLKPAPNVLRLGVIADPPNGRLLVQPFGEFSGKGAQPRPCLA